MWQDNYNYYLYHHGILGQRWGKKNGPPYPLGSSDHSASEKKAGWRKSLDKPNGSSHTRNSKVSKNTDNSEKDGFHLTDKQKKALKIGAVAVAASFAAYGTYKLAQSGKLNDLAAIGKAKVDAMLGKKAGIAGDIGQRKISDLPKGKPLNGDATKFSMSAEAKARVSEVSRKYDKFNFKDIANPIRNVDEIGRLANARCFEDFTNRKSTYNCKENSLTFFMRKVVGKDVVSPPQTVDGGLKDFVARYFKNDPDAVVATINTKKNEAYKGLNAEQVAKKFIEGRMNSDNPRRKFYDGDCGAFGCDEMGHTISWYIENGKVRLFNVKQHKSSRKTGDWLAKIPVGSTYQIVNYSQLNPAEALRELYK